MRELLSGLVVSVPEVRSAQLHSFVVSVVPLLWPLKFHVLVLKEATLMPKSSLIVGLPLQEVVRASTLCLRLPPVVFDILA